MRNNKTQAIILIFSIFIASISNAESLIQSNKFPSSLQDAGNITTITYDIAHQDSINALLSLTLDDKNSTIKPSGISKNDNTDTLIFNFPTPLVKLSSFLILSKDGKIVETSKVESITRGCIPDIKITSEDSVALPKSEKAKKLLKEAKILENDFKNYELIIKSIEEIKGVTNEN